MGIAEESAYWKDSSIKSPGLVFHAPHPRLTLQWRFNFWYWIWSDLASVTPFIGLPIDKAGTSTTVSRVPICSNDEVDASSSISRKFWSVECEYWSVFRGRNLELQYW
jgi:hypothetical protein